MAYLWLNFPILIIIHALWSKIEEIFVFCSFYVIISSYRMLLEFCADVCIFLARGEKNIAAIHCKAGKGRTGLMICGYLLFSEMVPNAEEAMELYAVRRTYNMKGLTIPSQRRFLKYFETFLEQKIQRPFFSLIPEIIQDPDNFFDNHFPTINKKKVKGISLGPFTSSTQIYIQVSNQLQLMTQYFLNYYLFTLP